MTIRIKCTTLFDITATGIKHRFHKSRLPFVDNVGNNIVDNETWQRSRNKQSNWETINQVISLRTLPENISDPVAENNYWSFEFDVVDPTTVSGNNDPVGAFQFDCTGVPMVTGLDEKTNLSPCLEFNNNIWFEIVNSN